MRTSLRFATAAALAAAPALVPHAVSAQSRVVDEGSFIVSEKGVQTGREAFRIVRSTSATGDLYRATAQIAYGDRRVMPTLSTDTLGVPSAYEVAVRQANTAILRLSARGAAGRMSVLEQTPRGESAKEYVVPRRVLLVDDDIFHQYYFLTLAAPAGPSQVIRPQSRVQGPATVERRGSESVEVGGQRAEAMRWEVSLPDGSRSDVWVDAAGRLLRVAIPARALVAQREELPR